jgi:DNA-binding transcriptional LysR family regulator
MELYQLRTFVTVADSGHLTRAAERIHLSQPAVSSHIKALEEELAVRLFERGPAGVALTQAGRELLEYAQRTLSSAEELRRAAKALKGDLAGIVRIGTISDPEYIRLGDFLSRAVERYPMVEIELHHEVTGAALEAVREGRLDASFYFGDIANPSVAGLALDEMAYRVTAPAAWCDRVREAGWSEIAAMPWVLTPSISTHNQLVTKLFAEHGVKPPTRHVEADQESVIMNLVVSGVGVSLMRENFALEKQQSGEVCVWEKVRLRTKLWFIYQAERAADPLVSALLGVLRETWQLGSVESAASRTPRLREALH